MEYYITNPADYWIAPNAVSITLNVLGDKNRIQGSVASGAVIMCFVEDIKAESAGGEAGNGDGLWYGSNHEPKRWPLSLSPTYFNSDTRKYVYVAIPRSTAVGTQAVIVFPSEQLDIYGRVKRNTVVEGETTTTYEQIGSTDYFYVYLNGIIGAADAVTTGRREWEDQMDARDWGVLETAQGRDEKQNSSEWYTYSQVNQIVTFLKEIVMNSNSSFRNLILNHKSLTDVATSTAVAPIDSDTMVATPNYISTFYLSKVANDVAAGHITFQQGLQSILTATFGTYNRVSAGSASGENTGAAILPDGTGDFVNLIVKGMVRGNLTVEDALSAASIVFSQTVKSQGALEGERGIIMNAADGTIEAGGIDVRGWLRVETLEKNMIQLMGKDFSFSEGGDIERVEVLDENEGLYLLYMHKEAEGKHTKIADNDILKGKMDELEEGGLYYTSWMQAYPYSPEHSAVTLNEGLLSDTVRVKLFADEDVDGGKNFPPKALMTVTTRGNTVNTNRQHFWELSATDKRLQFLWHVNSPKLTDSNYALVLGMLPHLSFFPTTINYQMPSLFAGGLVVDHQHIHHVNYPVPVDYIMRDLGSWQQGRRCLHGTIIYKDGRCEAVTDQLNHNGYTWKCVAPGTFTEQADGTWRYDGGTTAEPSPSSSDWMSVGGGSDGKDGKDSVTVQIISDLGNILRPGSSIRTLTAYVYRGEDDVTSTLLSTAFSWERSTGNETRDTAWNNQHKNIGNTLTISQTDVDFISSFSCIVNLSLTKQQS